MTDQPAESKSNKVTVTLDPEDMVWLREKAAREKRTASAQVALAVKIFRAVEPFL